MVSAPIRDSLDLSRHPASKSVKLGGNGVPGGTLGWGAESQKKSPLVSNTCGTKK
jgi:hypothetical protein